MNKGNECRVPWFGFEAIVVNGWPVDLVQISDGKLLYEPLGINAERKPAEVPNGKWWTGKDGLMAWRYEAPFDMEW